MKRCEANKRSERCERMNVASERASEWPVKKKTRLSRVETDPVCVFKVIIRNHSAFSSSISLYKELKERAKEASTQKKRRAT